MINLLLLLLLFTCLGIVAAWVAENPGTVVIHWYDYRIDTSLAFLILVALAVAFVLAYGTLGLSHLARMPKRYKEQKSLKYYRKGMTELTYSVAALAASDIRGAEAHTKKAQKLLGETPLVLLLEAQIARSKGDDATTRQLLEQMLTHKETEYLAARSLSDVAGKQQQLTKALALAERAHDLNPEDVVPLLSLQMRLEKWQEAEISLNKAVRKGRLSRNAWRHYRGLIHVQHGLQLLTANQPEAALAAARFGLKELPKFTPAITLAARAYAANGQPKKAINLLFAAMKTSPHPQLAETLRELIAQEPTDKQAKLKARLEGFKVEAPAAGESWVCSACGTAAAHWAAHCSSCSAFDTLEWKKREMRFVA